jgi:hypothetical protein
MAQLMAFLFLLFHPRTYTINVSLYPRLSNANVHALMLTAHLFVSFRASMFLGASQHIRGERVKGLGWEPRPVVLEDWAEEGITAALATLQ